MSSWVPNTAMGNFSVFMTMFLGVRCLVKPVMTTKEDMLVLDREVRMQSSLIGGILIGFVCGFIGAGGGMMMLLVLTSVLGYELKTAVGTSVFVMAFTALTESVSHFGIGGVPDLWCLLFCVSSTLFWARIAARIANRANALTLNRVTGVILAAIGMTILAVNLFFLKNKGPAEGAWLSPPVFCSFAGVLLLTAARSAGHIPQWPGPQQSRRCGRC